MSNSVSKAVKICFLVVLLNLTFSSSASAYAIDSQTQYALEGLFGGFLRPESGDGDVFQVRFEDIVFDGVLDEATATFQIEGDLDGEITNQTDGSVFEATMSFSVVYSDLDIGVDSATGVAFDAIGRSGSEAGLGVGTFEVSSSLVDFSVAAESKSASITESNSERVQDIYSELVGSGFFDLVLGNLAFFDEEEVFKSWIRSTAAPVINGQEYSFYGDFHTTVGATTAAGAVPEPATVLLLGLACLGLAAKSRRVAA